MKTLMLGLLVLVSACGVDKADDFRKGLPQAGDVALKLPAKSSQPLTSVSTRRDGLEGQTSDFYRLTRETTVFVNTGTAAVLTLVEKIVQYPATTVGQDSAVWGPHTEALSPNTWKLTVTRTATDTYSYLLEGKGKTEADSAYRAVLSGNHVTMGQNLGTGSFLIDWDLNRQLPENANNFGTVAVTYSRTSATATTQIDAQFTQVRHGTVEPLVDAQYRYWSTPNQGGSFEFQLQKDLVTGAALETGKIKSRWLESGAGRADAQVSGGDLSAPVTMNECWDSGFLSRFQDTSFSPALNYGAATACAFGTAEYPSL
ncbi:MAG: hypothetical protein Q8L48_15985 [Archangium sp.]|nr:hypothetical protein [Archangium sp.]